MMAIATITALTESKYLKNDKNCLQSLLLKICHLNFFDVNDVNDRKHLQGVPKKWPSFKLK